MEDHDYHETNVYICSQNISSETDNIVIEEKDGDDFLIELYRERPFLYNKGHNDFKNKIMKDNAWNEISKIMQNKNYGNFYTPDYCQTRCTSLRNQYNREKRILNNQHKSGSTVSSHKPFTFYSQLSFLDNYIRRRRTHNNININEALASSTSSELLTNKESNSCKVFNITEKSSDSIYDTEDEKSNGDEKSKENIEDDSQVTRKRAIENCLSSSNEKHVKYKKSKTDDAKELENIFSSVIQKIMSALDSKNNNEDEAFVQFIITHLANLPQSEKNTRKKMITDALFSPLQKISPTSEHCCKCDITVGTLLSYVTKHGYNYD